MDPTILAFRPHLRRGVNRFHVAVDLSCNPFALVIVNTLTAPYIAPLSYFHKGFSVRGSSWRDL